MTQEEKREDIQHLRNQITDRLICPILTAKFKSEVEPNLRSGIEDFLIYKEYSTDFTNGEKKGEIIPHTPWGSADKGYRVRANNISDLLTTISYILDTEEGTVFYFTCSSPDMGYPRLNTVEETQREYEEKINELQQSSEYVLDTYYDT